MNRQEFASKPVQKRLLLPLAGVYIFLLASFATGLILLQKNNLNQSSQEILGQSFSELSTILAEQSSGLTALMRVIVRDDVLQLGLKRQDRQLLYQGYERLFTQLRENHKITHFYVHRADRINLLRIHKPEKYGDLIDRFTALEAERTGSIASGIELGPLGTFTLRVVMPVMENNQLLGYIELGKEIEDALATIHGKYGTECFVTIWKDFLKRDEWEQGMRMLGRNPDWSRYKNKVIIYHSPEKCIGICDKLIEAADLQYDALVDETSNGKTWQGIKHQLRDASGTVVGDLLLSHDITQQKKFFTFLLIIVAGSTLAVTGIIFVYLFIILRKTDQDLFDQQIKIINNKEEIQKYIKAIDDMGIGLLLIDNNFHIRETNKTVTFWFGEQEGKLCYQGIFCADTPCLSCPLDDVIKTGKVAHFEVTSPDGRILDITATPLINPDRTISMMEILKDITGSRKAEQRLRENEEQLRTLINSTPDIICFKDAAGRWLEANDADLELFSLIGVDYRGKTDVDLAELTDPIYRKAFLTCKESDEKAWESKGGVRGEEVIVKPDGTEKIYDVIKMPIFENGGRRRGLVVLGRDITERKKAEQQLLKMEKLETVGTLAGGIAHDFNNVLVGIFGNIAIAKQKLDKNHSAYKSLEQAETSLNRATNLTGKLLTFATGGDPITEHINLGEIIKDVVDFDLSGSNVKLLLKQADDILAAEVDKGQIEQLFSNLVVNALQAMPDGGHLYISLENSKDLDYETMQLKPGRYIKVTIRDEGVGIDQQQLNKVFDPYFSTKQTGRGLGLATVYSIVHKHHGHISVQSETGKGTIFTLYLPASEKGPVQEHQEIENEHPGLGGFAKVLVMDDEKIVRAMIIEALEGLGCTVEAAVNGKEVLEKYQRVLDSSDAFDVVILDLTIPGGMGGKATIEKLLQIDAQAKVIVSSGYADDPIMAHYSDYGFKGVLAKPFAIKKLQDVIEKVINS